MHIAKLGFRTVTPRDRLSFVSFHRHVSTYMSPDAPSDSLISAASAAAAQLSHSVGDRTTTQSQVIDAHQVQRLSLTLGRPYLHPTSPQLDDGGDDLRIRPPRLGTPLPPGYHLAFFTPAAPESALGPDGTDAPFAPPPPFTRRMWAGGRVRWARAGSAELRVGDEVVETTRLVSAVPKVSRRRQADGGGGAVEMVLVRVRKDYFVRGTLALEDERSWIYQATIRKSDVVRDSHKLSPTRIVPGPSQARDVQTPGATFPERHLHWSPVGLFRFSALTFNAHMIHYNESWARDVEGQRGLVVHGPLNLINMLDYWRDVYGRGHGGIAEIDYRALSPIYAGEPYVIRAASTERRDEASSDQESERTRISVEKDGLVCMRGDITAYH
ncbi:hypothetical protein VTK73DRAFT_3071 [Phialemonium thermophilum]|uniref:Mesaconyl-C4 CoA hydratase n=1 Tax=Phialemonium thermophilum TaxID=223376 RepID=A0ABR3VND4_9PEZI